jgi:AcrR family transcriptional regulator
MTARNYHHGNLRAALIEAGVELARQGGPDAVVLREASRSAGVSHNAAYRHFADRDELLRAVCERCMTALAELMEQRIDAAGPPDGAEETAHRRLRATGQAYVAFASTEPGLFRTAFAVPDTLSWFGEGEGVGCSGLGPLQLLGAQLDGLVATGALPAERRPLAEFAAWSSVHGLATLMVEGPLRALPDADRELALTRLLDTIERGL